MTKRLTKRTFLAEMNNSNTAICPAQRLTQTSTSVCKIICCRSISMTIANYSDQ